MFEQEPEVVDTWQGIDERHTDFRQETFRPNREPKSTKYSRVATDDEFQWKTEVEVRPGDLIGLKRTEDVGFADDGHVITRTVTECVDGYAPHVAHIVTVQEGTASGDMRTQSITGYLLDAREYDEKKPVSDQAEKSWPTLPEDIPQKTTSPFVQTGIERWRNWLVEELKRRWLAEKTSSASAV